MIGYGWETKTHFKEWAQWLAKQRDDEYDPDCDMDARLWLGYHTRECPETAASCLLNSDGQCHDVENWARTQEFIAGFVGNEAQWETAAEAFLATLVKTKQVHVHSEKGALWTPTQCGDA